MGNTPVVLQKANHRITTGHQIALIGVCKKITDNRDSDTCVPTFPAAPVPTAKRWAHRCPATEDGYTNMLWKQTGTVLGREKEGSSGTCYNTANPEDLT